MNIVQLHERVRFWVDAVASTRFDSQDIDNALNVAIESKIIETYDQSRPISKSDSFQRTQKCRDILGPIVKKATSVTSGFTFAANEITIASTSNYNLLLSLGALVGSTLIDCQPQTYDRKNRVFRNPFRRPRITPSYLIYYIEEENKIILIPESTVTITNFELHYISSPTLVNYGIEYTSTKVFDVGNIVIAVEETVYNGTTYKIGDQITIVTGHLQITSGLVTFDYVNCSLRSLIHEEIARRAAINCLMSAGQADKAKLIREEITAS